jgi:uncharacterized cupin superfamily protein
MPNVFEPEWDAEQDRPPFTWRRARLGRQAGAEKLGASLLEVPPGASSFPLHVHHANEEMLVVLSGRPTLRTIDGERELEQGELVAFRTGRAGAHRLDNRSEEPVRLLLVSTMVGPEVVEYPDTGRVWGRTNVPGADPGPDDTQVMGRAGEHVDYLEGES